MSMCWWCEVNVEEIVRFLEKICVFRNKITI